MYSLLFITEHSQRLLQEQEQEQEQELDDPQPTGQQSELQSTQQSQVVLPGSQPTPPQQQMNQNDPVEQELPPPPNQQFGGAAAEEELTQSDLFVNIKKFKIYTKLRDLKYQLNNSDLVTRETSQIINILDIVISFFDVFDYDQLLDVVKVVSEKLDKLKLHQKK